MEKNKILSISKFVNFDTERCKYILTDDAKKIIFREKDYIHNCSEIDDWCDHVMCELIKIYCSGGTYNYSYIKELSDEDWFGVIFKTFDYIFENLSNWN